jgi:hypothetical protein
MCLSPVGWDHDLGGVFSGRAMPEASEIHLETQLKTARDKVAQLYARSDELELYRDRPKEMAANSGWYARDGHAPARFGRIAA